MIIRTDDIDRGVLDAVMLGIMAAQQKEDNSEALQRILAKDRVRFYSLDALKQLLPAALKWGAGALIAAVLAAIPGVRELGWTTAGAVALCVSLTGVAAMAGAMRAGYTKAQVLHSDLLAGFLPFLTLTRAERAYCEALVVLSRPELSLDEETARSLLAQFNRLMEHSRKLDNQRLELTGPPGSEPVERILDEREALAHRAAAAQDPAARASLEESLRLCDTRLENARAIVPVLERLDAQQEVIVQTLGSMHATLARSESARQPLATPGRDELFQRLEEIGEEAQSVEKAVEEVVTLGRA